MRFFSYKNRPVDLGPYPLERLKRTNQSPDLTNVPATTALTFQRPDQPESIVNAIADYQALLDLTRDGLVKKEIAEIPDDPDERSKHLKSFGYYFDASQMAVCDLTPEHHLASSFKNPHIEKLADKIKTGQTKSLASGVELVMAELRESLKRPEASISNHQSVLVFLYEYPRDPAPNEAGIDWIQNCQAERASVRASESAVVIANYIRLLGYEARAHTASTSDLDLNRLAVSAGLATTDLTNPYVGKAFGLAAISTTLKLIPDQPLAPSSLMNKMNSHGPVWWFGKGMAKNAFNRKPYKKRNFKDGAFAFESLKKSSEPTTFMDEERIPRVPKRTDMFARALFGDMGKSLQDASKNGHFLRKSAVAFAPRSTMAAMILLQDDLAATGKADHAANPDQNADAVKAALYFLGADAVGISRCPDWAYYSHDAAGEEITPYHNNAISVVIDQGHETMEGASGDDWIASAQSMRAYLRFSLLGGIVANHIRSLGYEARTHTVMDGEVLQPPLLLLSGLGEVSRIGEVILNPFLGPRLKSGVITTNMPLSHDQPIDFGLQNFCENCNKCARECPSGAITAGPKKMFNGYEIWKSDSQKCTAYRLTQTAGSMCGRCMKTCPWNLEGLFAEAPFRWLAMKMPGAAKSLAKFDDWLGNGSLNPTKKWWWDIEMSNEGPYKTSSEPANVRSLQTDLDLKYEDQTLAVYPANLAPPPYPGQFVMDREKGIEAEQNLLSPKQYREKLARGETDHLAPVFQLPDGPPPMFPVIISKVEKMTDDVTKYEFVTADGSPLPDFTAGAHIDVVVAPEYIRQYSLSGDPGNLSTYQIAVLREDEGRGGSKLMHRIFSEGRKIYISQPHNHFPLEETAQKNILMGGGIGITPMIAMAHTLHTNGQDFELHYSAKSPDQAGFIEDLKQQPWADKITLHFSSEGTRADLESLFSYYKDGDHVYSCGPDRYIAAIVESCEKHGWPEEAVHREYFSVPDDIEYTNYPFTVHLAKSNQNITVPENQSAAEALNDAGFNIDIKCSDGLCGVCKCGLLEGDVEHRDFVLSKKQREDQIILCSSRATDEDGRIVIDL